MDLDKANRWLTLAANIGVMAGIIFLAFELQQNTVATQLEAASNFQDSFSEIDLFIAGNPEFAELLRKGREGEELLPAEELRLWVFYGNVLRQWQLSYSQYLAGALTEGVWVGNRTRLVQIISEDRGLYEHWQTNKTNFDPAFIDMIEAMRIQGPVDQTQATQADSKDKQRNELAEFATRYADAWSSQDAVALASFYAEEGTFQVNDGDMSVGRKAIAETAGGFMAAFPDMVVRLVKLRETEDGVEFHWHWTGTNTGPGGTGNAVDLRGYEQWTLDENGLILKSQGNMDDVEYQRQLNAETAFVRPER